ncbi:hypothetical protein K1719_000573 [Acacia pycnantha]|nr:hypothetical protein K1719_000573 [Acacia pycnantha]
MEFVKESAFRQVDSQRNSVLHLAVYPIYVATFLPVTFFALVQLPLYFDLVLAICGKVPQRSYKRFHQDFQSQKLPLTYAKSVVGDG